MRWSAAFSTRRLAEADVMVRSERFLVSRRRFLTTAAIAVPALAGGSALLSGCSSGGGSGAVRVASAGFLDTIAEMVIPRTNTPGARDMKVGAYMERAFAHGLFGGDEHTGGALEAVLDKRVPSGVFMKASEPARLTALKSLDTETFARKVPPAAALTASAGGSAAPAAQIGSSTAGTISAPPEPEANRLWRTAKNAITVGYYMSEGGASRELQYELVPGRFDPDIPYKPGDTYLSNNWMANGG